MTRGDEDAQWAAIDGLRTDIGRILAEVQGLTSALGERCEVRAAHQISLEQRMATLEAKYHVLDKTILRVSLVTGAISAVLASAGTALIAQTIAAWGGR